MTKREEAEQAMRLGPILYTEAERVGLLREAINEALEQAASRADGEAGMNDVAATEAEIRGAAEVAMRFRCRSVAARSIAEDIRALKKER